MARPDNEGGFRLRGREMTRTETFTDAAFAFALTLLVVSIDHIPQSFDELAAAMQGIPAFGLSCALLFLFWHGHWNWSRRYGLEDFPSMVLSFVLVFAVLCYVYPMRYMTSIFTNWVTGGRLSADAQIESLAELYGIFTIYSIGFSVMCAVIIGLYWRAWRLRDMLELNAAERFVTRAEMGSWSILAGVGLAATLMGLFAPQSMWTIPGWVYLSLPVVMPVYGMVVGRRYKRLASPSS